VPLHLPEPPFPGAAKRRGTPAAIRVRDREPSQELVLQLLELRGVTELRGVVERVLHRDFGLLPLTYAILMIFDDFSPVTRTIFDEES